VTESRAAGLTLRKLRTVDWFMFAFGSVTWNWRFFVWESGAGASQA